MATEETCESALTCAKCGKVALWRKVRVPSGFPGHLLQPTDTMRPDPQHDVWWLLEIPCVSCSSQLFDVRVDNPRSHMQLFGVNA